MIKTLKDKINVTKANVKYALTNKSGASLWEYLLLIAIVIIIGGALIAVITGENGIASLWDGLMTNMRSWLNLAPAAPAGG